MADKLHRHRGLAIDRLLEGKDHEHAVGNLPHRLHPPGTPRPQLRADVVDDRNAEAFDAACQRKIEVGKIDDDERVGPLGARPVDQAPKRRQRSRNFRDRLRQARHGKAAVIRNRPAARRDKLGPSEAGHHRAGRKPDELADQSAGVQIAGCFAAGKQETRRHITGV